jgi:hypothetical protein
MALRVERLEWLGLMQERVHIAATCDCCGERITADTPGNFEYEPREGSAVFLVHKRCSRRFRAGRNMRNSKWSTLDLRGVEI